MTSLNTIKEFWSGKINYGQIGDQTGLFYTINPVFYTSGNRFVRRTGTLGNLWFFHLFVGETPDQNSFIVSFIVPPYEVQGHWQN
jgi:hypothetical protein